MSLIGEGLGQPAPLAIIDRPSAAGLEKIPW
jgi:hypothetical protein